MGSVNCHSTYVGGIKYCPSAPMIGICPSLLVSGSITCGGGMRAGLFPLAADGGPLIDGEDGGGCAGARPEGGRGNESLGGVEGLGISGDPPRGLMWIRT